MSRHRGAGEAEWARDDTIERVRGSYDYRQRRFAARRDGDGDVDGYEARSEAYQRLLHELIVAQRAALVTLRKQGAISDQVMRRVERELDLEEDPPGDLGLLALGEHGHGVRGDRLDLL